MGETCSMHGHDEKYKQSISWKLKTTETFWKTQAYMRG
jgi:hypothetical protein